MKTVWQIIGTEFVEATPIILVMSSNLHNLLDLFMVASDISTFAFFYIGYECTCKK